MIKANKYVVIALSMLLIVCFAANMVLAKKNTIGFIPMTLSNEYFITMVNAAKQEAARQDVELLTQAGLRHGSALEQLEIIENMITLGVDAICIVPSNPKGVIAALGKAQRAGIPVINLDTIIDPVLVEEAGLKTIPFIGTDNYDGAKKAGERALELLNGEGQAAILTGIAGHQNTKDRRNGFFDVVNGKLEVVAEQTANWEVEQGYNVAQNILQANPDLDIFFASNDNMGLGAYRALKEAGRTDVIVIGYDAVPAALTSVSKGEFDSTVAQFPAEMGIKGVQAAVKMLNGESVPDITYTKTQLITKENVEEFKTYLEQFK